MTVNRIMFQEEAVQYDGTNIADLVALCPDVIAPVDLNVDADIETTEPTLYGVVINDTDWVVKRGSESYELLTEDEFEAQYVASNDIVTTYTGTITWTGSTAPSSTTTHRFFWSQVGNMVSVTIIIKYATAGSGLTQATLDLPATCPVPTQPAGLTGASEVLYWGTGALQTTASSTSGSLDARCYLHNNAAANGFQITVVTRSGAHRMCYLTVTYYTLNVLP